jgi:hypothetical protein
MMYDYGPAWTGRAASLQYSLHVSRRLGQDDGTMEWPVLYDLEIPAWRLGFLGYGACVLFRLLIPRRSKLRLLT